MKLPRFLCIRIHCPLYYVGHTSKNRKKQHKIYQPAFWCFKCQTFRFLDYPWCDHCNAYMAKRHTHFQWKEEFTKTDELIGETGWIKKNKEK